MSSIKKPFIIKHNRLNLVIHYAIPILFLCMIIFYYFPIYGVIWLLPDKLFMLGDLLYQIINPFTIAPAIIGFIFMIINIKYKDIVLKMLFLISYILSILLSGFLIPVMISLKETYVYIPSLLVIGLNTGIVIKRKMLCKFNLYKWGLNDE